MPFFSPNNGSTEKEKSVFLTCAVAKKLKKRSVKIKGNFFIKKSFLRKALGAVVVPQATGRCNLTVGAKA